MVCVIDSCADLLSRYDVVFCDIWGVMHDGHKAYQGANAAMQRFRQDGGTVILVSNAPVPAERVAEMLRYVGVVDDAWDWIVASGDIALRHIAERGYAKLYAIGPRDRDDALFSRLPEIIDDVTRVDAIVCSGLDNDQVETAESYRAVLETARSHNIPFVCANPDLVVDVGGTSYLCAGVIGSLYETLGGDVYWAGKPHRSAFDTAMDRAKSIRGEDVPLSRTLVIGDALRTDMRGAKTMGTDALFVAGGIHREDTMKNAKICPAKLESFLSSEESFPLVAAMAELRW